LTDDEPSIFKLRDNPEFSVDWSGDDLAAVLELF
jgi:hypothetical protein